MFGKILECFEYVQYYIRLIYLFSYLRIIGVTYHCPELLIIFE